VQQSLEGRMVREAEEKIANCRVSQGWFAFAGRARISSTIPVVE